MCYNLYMKKSLNFSIKQAEKVYKKLNGEAIGLRNETFEGGNQTSLKLMDNWITVGGSSDFEKRLITVNSWQTGATY